MASRRPLHTKPSSTSSTHVSDSAASSDSRPVKKSRFDDTADSHVNIKSTPASTTASTTAKPTTARPISTATSTTASTAVSTRPVVYDMSPPAPISVSKEHSHTHSQQQSKMSRGHMALKALGVTAPPTYNTSGNKRPHSHLPLVSFADDVDSTPRAASLTRSYLNNNATTTPTSTDNSQAKPTSAPSLPTTSTTVDIALDTVRGPNNSRDLYLKLKAAHFQRVHSSSATAAVESTATTTTTTSPTYTTDTTDDA